MKDYYALEEADFSRPFIEWVLTYWELDHWPLQESSATDAGSNIQHSQGMPSYAWIETKAEISRRLRLVPIIEAAWIFYYFAHQTDLDYLRNNGYSPYYRLARESGTTAREVERRCNKALNFISWGRDNSRCRHPRGTYAEWCEKRESMAQKAREGRRKKTR